MQNVRLMMLVAAGLVLLATALAALDVPLSSVMTPPWLSVEVLVGAGLVVALVAAFAGKWRRSRQRKMLRDMRDSALW